MPEITKEEWERIKNVLDYLQDVAWWDLEDPDKLRKEIDRLIVTIDARNK